MLTALSSLSVSALAQDHDHGGSATAKSSQQAFSGDPYLLGTDPVTSKKLVPIDKQIVIEHEGRELRFNSDESVRAFRADPAKVLTQVDAALVTQQLPFYPLQTCPVSGEKLGKMGEPIDLVYRNRLVRLCCKGCKSKFLKDSGKFVTKLDAAVVAAQGPKYSLKTCVVSGEELGGEMGEPIDYVVGNRLVRLCCKGCKKKVSKDPLTYLAKLDASKAEKGHGEKADGDGHGGHGDDGHGGHGDH
jgi:YHS domain-containing protein